MNGTCNGTIFWSPPPGALERGQKVKHNKISITNSISKMFKLNFVCLLTNERYKTFKTGFSFGPLGHACPRVWEFGGAGGQKFTFLNMVMWHIKLKEMNSRPRYTENFYPRIKLVTLGWGQRIKYH